MTPKYDWVAGQYKSKLIAFSSVIVYFVFRLSLSERLWRWQSIEITNLLSVPRARTTFASRRFNVAVLSVWNSLLLAFALIVSRSQWSHTFRCLHNKKKPTVWSTPSVLPSGSRKCLRFDLRLANTTHYKAFYLLPSLLTYNRNMTLQRPGVTAAAKIWVAHSVSYLYIESQLSPH